MGFFDFFRRRKEEIRENEVVGIVDLNSWIARKFLEVEKEKKIFFGVVKERISRLVKEVKEGVQAFENLNWEKIKAEDRIKNAVRENLVIYGTHLEKLASDLEDLEGDELSRKKIDSLFKDFDKRAGMNYQKSSFLIGKELEKVNRVVENFFRDLDNMQRENKDLIDSLEVISVMNGKLKEFKGNEKLGLEVQEGLKKIEGEVVGLKKQISGEEKIIEEIKKSDEYLEEEKRIEKLENDKKKLKRELVELRGLIDFKSLARIWHGNKKEMNVVKEYRENFQEAFWKDKGESIVGVIGKSDFDRTKIDDVMSRILAREKEIESVKLDNGLTFSSEEKIKKNEEEIEKLFEKKKKEEKRVGKLEVEKKIIFEEIGVEMGKIGVSVEG